MDHELDRALEAESLGGAARRGPRGGIGSGRCVAEGVRHYRQRLPSVLLLLWDHLSTLSRIQILPVASATGRIIWSREMDGSAVPI